MAHNKPRATWPERLALVVVTIVMAYSMLWSSVSTYSVEYNAISNTTATSSQSPTATSSVAPSAVSTQTAETIAPSPPTELVIESVGLDLALLDYECPAQDGAVTPPLTEPDAAHPCYYTNDGLYSLPGGDAPDLAAIFGHTGRGSYSGLDAAPFNRLYDGLADFDESDPLANFRVQIGDEIRVRTEASGDAWLVYQITALYAPEKGTLADSPVWGDEPRPGVLVLVGCLQQPGLNHSIRNIVVEAEFVGVE